MQTSIATPFAAAFAVCAVGGGLYYLNLRHLRTELSDVRSDLKAAHTKVEELRDEKTLLFAKVLEQKKQIEGASSIDKNKSTIALEIAALEKEFSSVREEFLNHVRRVRNGASGELIPVLRLSNGQALNNVKVQAVTDYDMIASHDKGVARVPLMLLPDPFRQRFRADVVPEKSPEPPPSAKHHVAAVPEIVPTYVPEEEEDVRKLPPLPSSKTLPRVVPPWHTPEQNRLTAYKRSVRVLKQRIADLEAMELKDEQAGIAKSDFGRPDRFSDDPEQRGRELAAEEKRLNDLARTAEATSNRRQSEIADLKERIAKYEVEIAKLEATRYR